MRPRSATGAIIAATLLLASGGAAAQSRPEYETEIADDRVYVLSGPGTNFYPTNILNRDDRVTVYGRPVGEFVQILPPIERSFSWMKGVDVEELDSGDVVVKTDGASAFVGSEIHREARFVRQVRLPRGARVKVLDKVMVYGLGPDAGKLHEWYKILPPDDEVRYVLAAKIRQPNQAVLVPQAPGGMKTEPGADSRLDAASVKQTPPAVRRLFRPDESIPPAAPVSGAKILDSQPASSGSDKSKGRRAPGANGVEIERLGADLDRIQDKLPQEWNLNSLEGRLTSIERSAENNERAVVDSLRQRIRQMRSAERRLKEIEDRGRQYRQEDTQLSTEIDRVLGVGARSRTRFNAQGRLEPSKTLVDGKTSYQIVDDRKRATHLVLPAPGINLDKHLRRRVGVIGRLEPRTGVSLPVLRATQVSLLGD